jgi:hypothetical protein
MTRTLDMGGAFGVKIFTLVISLGSSGRSKPFRSVHPSPLRLPPQRAQRRRQAWAARHAHVLRAWSDSYYILYSMYLYTMHIPGNKTRLIVTCHSCLKKGINDRLASFLSRQTSVSFIQ